MNNLNKFVFLDCVDGAEDSTTPCQPRSCANGQWITMIIDCAPPQNCAAMNKIWQEPLHGECCGMCVEPGNHINHIPVY